MPPYVPLSPAGGHHPVSFGGRRHLSSDHHVHGHEADRRVGVHRLSRLTGGAPGRSTAAGSPSGFLAGIGWNLWGVLPQRLTARWAEPSGSPLSNPVRHCHRRIAVQWLGIQEIGIAHRDGIDREAVELIGTWWGIDACAS